MAATLALAVLVIVVAGPWRTARDAAVAWHTQQAQALLLQLAKPADLAALAAQQAGHPQPQTPWLAVCIEGGGAPSQSIPLVSGWLANQCPGRGQTRAADGSAAPLPDGRSHIVWGRSAAAPGREVGIVFDSTMATLAIGPALSEAAQARAAAIAACLLALLGLWAIQARAVGQLYRHARRARRDGFAAPLRQSPAVCREIVGVGHAQEAALHERREVDERTNEVLVLMRRTWQQCHDAVLLVDAAGCVVFCNASGQALLRDPGDRVMGLSIEAVLPGVTLAKLRERVRSPAPGGSDTAEQEHSVMLCRRNGELLDLDLRVSLVGIDGEPVYLLLVSPRTGAGAMPGLATPARAAPADTGLASHPLIASVSHELRTPLNGIIGMTDLLGRTPLQPEQQDILETLRTSTHQLRSLLNDLLDIAKVEAGQLHLEFVTFDLAEHVGRCIDGFRGSAQQKDIRLELRRATPQLIVSADPLRVRQILNNLIDNALKFTPRSGSVIVTMDVEPPAREGADLRVAFSVKDTGVGIPADQLSSIFEPFHQASDSTARQFGGTGLGLSLVRMLCRAMNGDIVVESRPGTGSTFHFWLELKRASSSTAFADTQPMENANDEALLRGRRVLVADDNLVNQKLLTRWLEQEGMVVELAADGEQAVRRARQGGIDLILMDLSMPVMNGFDATRAIRNLARASAAAPGHVGPVVGPVGSGAPGAAGADGQRLATVPIIGVTARAMPGDRETALASGMDGYVTKPLRRQELLRAMASTVRGEADTVAEPLPGLQVASDAETGRAR